MEKNLMKKTKAKSEEILTPINLFRGVNILTNSFSSQI